MRLIESLGELAGAEVQVPREAAQVAVSADRSKLEGVERNARPTGGFTDDGDGGGSSLDVRSSRAHETLAGRIVTLHTRGLLAIRSECCFDRKAPILFARSGEKPRLLSAYQSAVTLVEVARPDHPIEGRVFHVDALGLLGVGDHLRQQVDFAIDRGERQALSLAFGEVLVDVLGHVLGDGPRPGLARMGRRRS